MRINKGSNFPGVKFLKTFSLPSLERVVAAAAAAAKNKEDEENIKKYMSLFGGKIPENLFISIA